MKNRPETDKKYIRILGNDQFKVFKVCCLRKTKQDIDISLKKKSFKSGEISIRHKITLSIFQRNFVPS